jgi:hypothetical protein
MTLGKREAICPTVVLRKLVEDRKLLEEGVNYAATPKISAIAIETP